MKCCGRSAILVFVVLAIAVHPGKSMAQAEDFDFASGSFIVKVREGVAPTVLPDGRPTFTYGEEADQIPGMEITELLMANFLEECGATAIEPLIHVQLEGEVLALAIEHGVMQQYTVDVPADADIVLATTLLSLFLSHVEYASPNWYVEYAQTNDPLFDQQWALDNVGQAIDFPCFVQQGCGPCGNAQGAAGTPDADISAPEAWSLQTGDPLVIVATIDTGADMDHPDLIGSLVSGENFTPGECPDACDLPNDPENTCPGEPCDTAFASHGTFIAGIIAAATDNAVGIAGVSRGSRVKPLRIGSSPLLATIKNALVFAANDDAVKVISYSLDQLKPGALEPELAMIFASEQKLMVAAAGNCFPPPCMPPVNYPASDSRVMAVASTNFDDERSCFSHGGPALSVAAPGEDIVSTVNPEFLLLDCGSDPDLYCRSNGTSFATPHVAGLAALIWSVDMLFTDDEVRRIIHATADDLGPPGHDIETGCGRINAFRAVSRARCPADINEDGAVATADLLQLLGAWGTCEDLCCPADINGDGAVATADLLDLLGQWGACPELGPPPPSLAEVIAAAGLTQEQWNTLMDCVVNGTPTASANCVCWMEHYLVCHSDPECQEPSLICPATDPLGGH